MKHRSIFFALTPGVLALTVALQAAAQDSPQSGQMTAYSDMALVEGSTGMLTRMEHGLFAKIDTSGLTPGDAVTMFWVVFNEPARCSGGSCGGDDIFNISDGKIVPNEDGSAPMNRAGIEAAGVSVLHAGGRIVDPDGSASFRGHLPIADVTEAAFGPGVLDTEAAEIHVVLRSHGAPGETTGEMLNSFNGGCAAEWPNAPCRNVQFIAFKSPGGS